MELWKEVKVGELGRVITGKTPKTAITENYGGRIPFLTPSDDMTVKYVNKTSKTLTEKGLSEVKNALLPKNSVCVSCIGSDLGKVVVTTVPTVTNQQINSIVVDETKYDVSFVYYAMLILGRELNFISKTSTAVPIVNKSSFSSYEIKCPPLEMQKKIAITLSALDAKIENNRRTNENLDQQGQALVKKYCDLNPSKALLGSIMAFANGFAFQSSSYLPYGTYKIITIKNVQDGKIDSQGSAYINDIPPRMKSECLLHIGDVLLSLTGNVGRVGIVCEDNLLLNQRVAKLVPNDLDLLPYLYFYFRLPGSKTSLETIAKGTAQQNLSPIETLKMDISYDKMVRELSQSLLPMFRCIIANQEQNQRLSNLRDTLLPRLMSGELDVSGLDL